MYGMLRHIFWLLALSLIFTTPVNAQTANDARLFSPNTGTFPKIGIYLDAHDTHGGFMHGIHLDDVQVFEDDRQIKISEFKEIRPGVQIVIALNPGRSFLVRNSKGLSRYDIIASSITSWAMSRTGSTLDDMSLIVPDSPGRTHLVDPLDLAQATSAYIVNDKTISPNLDLVSDAIDLANDPPPRAGMERVILLFTSPLENNQSQGIQDLVTRAAQNQIRIFIWLVGAPDSFNEKNIAGLESLATQTGGAFIPYTADEMISNLEDYLDPLRSVYYLEYQSLIRKTGTHQLLAQFQYNGEQITTPLLNFEIEISPPKPAFVFPPTAISRTEPTEKNPNHRNEIQAKEYLPKEVSLQILVEFPDSRPRSLVRSTLYIDQVVAAENLKAPFDQFIWDISKYTETGQHVMRVEVEDSLGLIGSSIETPVDVLLPTPHFSLAAKLSPHLPWIASLVAAGSGLLLAFILLVNGKIHPNSHGWLKDFRKTNRNRNKEMIKPPAADSFGIGGRKKANWTEFFQKSPPLAPQALAYLIPVENGETTQNLAPIPITQGVYIVGRDSLLPSLTKGNPTIEPEHARITRRKDQNFYINDMGTRAGTWVNYTPITGEGVLIEHGDLIHFGSIAVQFSQPDHNNHKKIVVKEAFDYDPF